MCSFLTYRPEGSSEWRLSPRGGNGYSNRTSQASVRPRRLATRYERRADTYEALLPTGLSSRKFFHQENRVKVTSPSGASA